MNYDPRLAALVATADDRWAEPVRGARRPDLFIIGSMKSGTTYLHSLLGLHPSIFMSRPKEPSAFVEPEQLRRLWPWAWKLGYWKSEERYLQLFQSAGTATIVGTGSVYYTHLPLATGVPERIHLFNPNARLLYVMRDPVERTISHYWHRVRHHGEHRSLGSAIKNDPQYRDVSYYAMQLAPYFGLFRRDQIKTLTFEELINNRNQTIASIFRWLKVDCRVSIATVSPENVTPNIIKQRTARSLYGLRENRFLRAAIDAAPDSVRRFAIRMVTRKIDRSCVDTSEITEYLRPLQQAQTKELTKLDESFWNGPRFTGDRCLVP